MLRILALIALLMVLSPTAYAQETGDPTGLWLTENKRSAISIKRCDEGLCGRIVWIIEGGMQTDSKNPDETQRERRMCGLKLLWGFKQHPKNVKVWDGGKIYKADEGDTYNATLSVKDAETLSVRGYVGMPLLGKSQTWKRVNPKDYPTCK